MHKIYHLAVNSLLSMTFIVFGAALLAQSTSSDVQGNVTANRQTVITKAVAEVSPAVVGVNVTQIKQYRTHPFVNDPLFNMFFGETYRRKVPSLGSGIIVSPDGYVLTNYHVVESAVEIIITTAGGEQHKAEIIGSDQVTDLALLKIDVKNHPYAKLGNSDDVVIGEWVVALGNPFGLFDISYQPTATVGIISGKHLDFGEQSKGQRYQDMIQTDAAINGGNSGGPLVNADGNVIGINTFIFTSDRYNKGSIGIGFAIPINRAKQIMADLKKHGKIDWSFDTGLKIQAMDKSIADAMNIKVDHGLIVTGVRDGSPADKAGIKFGDVITEAQGSPVQNEQDIFAAIQNNYLHAGDILKLTVMRNEKPMTINLKLETVK